MAAKTFTFRLASEGAQQVVSDLKQAATASQEAARALDTLTKSSPQLASAADGAQVKLQTTATALSDVGKNAKDAEKAANAARNQLRNLTIQATQFVSGIATGQPVMMAFVQQAHQVGDSLLAGGVSMKGLGTELQNVVGKIGGWKTVVGAGVVAVLAAMAVEAEKADRQLAQLGTRLAATRSNAGSLAAMSDAVARQLAPQMGISVTDARSAASTIAAQPNFTGTSKDLLDLTRTAADLAARLGTDVPHAAGLMAEALKDPAKAAEDLAQSGFRGMTQQIINQINAAERGGDALRAFALWLQAVRTNADGAWKEGLIRFPCDRLGSL